MSKNSDTPILDELEDGPWPSFVKDLKALGERKPVVKQLLQQVEQSYKDVWNYWQGAVVNVPGYGGGVIARLSELSDKYPDLAQFNTIRILEPPGWVYNTDALRELCDISEEYSAGILQFHGMTGDILMLGSNNERTFEAAEALFEKGWDIGGSGPALRTLACCIGQARCEMACFDTMGLTKYLTDKYIGFLHRPEFAYKFKFKISGCANDCACAVQRSDMPIIGTWRGPIQIDKEEVAKFIDENGVEAVIDNVIGLCPTRAISLKGKEIVIQDEDCTRCMHCINVMHKALAPGKDRGAALLLGGKRTLKIGDTMSSIIVPFIKLDTEEDREKLAALVERIWDFWNENALEHERIGEFIERVGLGTFLDGVGLDPDPRMVAHPRTSVYIKFEELTTPLIEGEKKQDPSVLNKDIDSPVKTPAG